MSFHFFFVFRQYGSMWLKNSPPKKSHHECLYKNQATSIAYFHRTVTTSPDKEQLSIELSISSMRSLGGYPAIRTNSFPSLTSGKDCYRMKEGNKTYQCKNITLDFIENKENKKQSFFLENNLPQQKRRQVEQSVMFQIFGYSFSRQACGIEFGHLLPVHHQG